jgi:hypothetical protein
VKLYLPSNPTRRYNAKKASDSRGLPYMLFGKAGQKPVDPAGYDKLLCLEDLDGPLWGEDEDSLLRRAQEEGKL